MFSTGSQYQWFRGLTHETRDTTAVQSHARPYQVLLYLLREGPARNTEIATEVGVTPSTISWHLSNLREAGVVEESRDGRTVRYNVTNEELTVQLLVRYQERFVDRAVDRIIDFWG